jgi:hypothetical protein
VIPGEYVAQDEQIAAHLRVPSNPWSFTLTPDDDPRGCPCGARTILRGLSTIVVPCDNTSPSGSVCARCAIECRTQEAAA